MNDPCHPNCYRVPPKIAVKLMREAMQVATSVKVDQLDCGKSFAREDTDKTVDEVLAILTDKSSHTLWNFIERQGYGCEDYYDVGGSSIGKRPEYFLWITVNLQSAAQLVKKYRLKLM